MRNKKRFSVVILIALVALSIPSMAQNKEKESTQQPPPSLQEAPKASTTPWANKVIEVKYADVNRVGSLLEFFGVHVKTDSDLKVITANGPASNVAAAEEAIKKLDVPPPPRKSIDLSAYLLVASRQSTAGIEEVPSQLHEVVNRLKDALNYPGFRLLTTLLMRTRDGGDGQISGLATGDANHDIHYDFRISRANIGSDGKASVVKINGMSLALEEPGRPGSYIRTDLDVPEGQKVVVGKTSFRSPENALILILTAKLVE